MAMGKRFQWTLGAALAVTAWGPVSTAQAGPIIDWFKSLCPDSKPPCTTPGCGPAPCGAVPQANPYYPGAPMAPAGVVPGPVMPGTTIPGTTVPGTVTPGPALPPRTTNYAPAVYYPGTAANVPMGYPNAQVAYYAPAAGTVACPTCPQPVRTNQPTVVNYAPYTAYRNAWVQVPVTVYRPVSAIDPATGRPITVVQPCAATTWQVQRVPVGRPFAAFYQPLPVSGYAPAAAPRTVMPAGAMPGAAVPGVAVPGAATCPGGVCTPGAAVGAWPGAVPGAVPSAPVPGTTVPNSGAWPGGTYSAAPPPPSLGPAPSTVPANPPSFLGQPARVLPGTNGSGAVPADQRPMLGPGEGAGSSNYPPATDPYASPPPYIPPTTPSSSRGAAVTPPPAAGGGVAPASPSSAPRALAPVPRATAPLQVTPLPDPEAPTDERAPSTAPRLIVPRERTAAGRGTQPRQWLAPGDAAEASRSGARATGWDDSGWRTAGP
ncbi:MAG: hypothetical protein U0935_15895 [Pirellulales bacterium]